MTRGGGGWGEASKARWKVEEEGVDVGSLRSVWGLFYWHGLPAIGRVSKGWGLFSNAPPFPFHFRVLLFL